MDFSWNDEQLQLHRAAVEFGQKELKDDLIARDGRGQFPRELWDKCAEFGVQGLPFPREFGGQGLDILTTVFVMEALGLSCKDSGLLFGINAQMWSVQMPLWRFGTDRHKKHFLTGLCRGEIIGAHGMSEPGSGSDAFGLRTSAVKDGDSFVLNGTKTFVSNAPVADLFIVFAVSDKRKGFMGIDAFLIEKGTPGFTIGNPISKMGLRTSPFSELSFEECRIPLENRIGREGQGSEIFEDSMEWERSFILANYLGAMERQLNDCVAYARTRRQFDRPISKFQAVSHKLADMKVRLETSRYLVYRVAWLKDTNRSAAAESAITKVALSEAWIQSCLDAVQIHGGYGYTTEYGVERDLRDSIGSTLYSGTSEMLRNTIARLLKA